MIPFKIYTRKDLQTRFKRNCSYQNQFELVSRTNRFLPFIIKRSTISDQLVSWRVYDLDDVLKYTILPTDTSYQIFTSGSYQYIIYYSAQISGLDMDCGSYYLKISDGTNTWYSEVFTVKDFTTNTNTYSTLEWSHSHDVGDLIYQTGYVNRLFLDIELGEPEYDHEEEVGKDILGNEEDLLIRNQKVYKTVIYNVPEFIVDSLTLSLHGANEISLIVPENEETITVKQVRTEVSWINDGCFANVNVSFKVEESLIQKTCNDDDTLTSVTVNELPSPEILLVSTTNPSSAISTDGSITVSVSNYDEPEYSLDQETWQASGVFTGLSEGSHIIYVRVESGKTGTITVVLFHDCSYFNGSETSDLISVFTNQITGCNTDDFI